jgi:hypothetical protein
MDWLHDVRDTLKQVKQCENRPQKGQQRCSMPSSPHKLRRYLLIDLGGYLSDAHAIYKDLRRFADTTGIKVVTFGQERALGAGYYVLTAGKRRIYRRRLTLC